MIKLSAVILVVAVLSGLAADAYAQQAMPQMPKVETPAGSDKETERKGSAWTLDLPLGSHIPSTLDTLTYN